ncbi:hypothetical protein [Saccharospirillum salsuginis]|uniref:Lipoprotein n=1 Tax=Saccharospirillum salsuginis TaxID=418750 RepID=A0A918KEW2_9GAMM|nr:hypothetical protein [Saccharospirillum salsuginis]GGX58699.1 hypothetical protein GCM10007392_28300 [Saccharospirillum salsuginis]
MTRVSLPTLVVAAAATVLTACNSSGGGSAAIENRDAYFDSLSSSVNANVEAGASAMAGASASGSSAPGFVSTDDSTARVLPHLEVFSQWSTRLDTRSGDTTTGFDIDTFLDNLEEYGTLTDTSSGLLFQPDSSRICTGDIDVNRCTAVANASSIEFTQSGEQSGSVVFQFETQEVFILEFSQNSLAGTWVLQGMKAFLEAVDPDANNLPNTFNGRFKAKVEATGTNSGRITTSVPEAINVGDDTTDYQLNLGQTGTLLMVEGNDDLGTGSVSVDVSALDLRLAEEDDPGVIWDLAVPAFSFDMTGDNKGTEDNSDDDMTVTASLASPGIVLKKGSEDQLTVDAFTLDASMTSGVLTFNEALNFAMMAIEDATTNELDVQIASGTELQSTDDCNGKPGTDVLAGSVDITVSENDTATIDVSASAGACFEEDQ